MFPAVNGSSSRQPQTKRRGKSPRKSGPAAGGHDAAKADESRAPQTTAVPPVSARSSRRMRPQQSGRMLRSASRKVRWHHRAGRGMHFVCVAHTTPLSRVRCSKPRPRNACPSPSVRLADPAVARPARPARPAKIAKQAARQTTWSWCVCHAMLCMQTARTVLP